jgi:hypothetical protein
MTGTAARKRLTRSAESKYLEGFPGGEALLVVKIENLISYPDIGICYNNLSLAEGESK